MFQDALGKMRELFDHESMRSLRVNQILLEADNDTLQLEKAIGDEECCRVSETDAKLKSQLRAASREIANLQTSLNESARLVEELKVSGPSYCDTTLLDVLCAKLNYIKERGDITEYKATRTTVCFVRETGFEQILVRC